jgi:thiol-disulfide isomerase/thioredoxin
MNKNLIIGVIIAIVIICGIIFFISRKSQINISTTPSAQTQKTDEGAMIAGYNGKVLAGNKSPYIIFNMIDYEKAIASNKIVFLDFYANWCPICREESPNLRAGFDALETDKVVGFRVNYNDSDTDENEKALAKEFGIVYQHTKVILKNGKEVSKSLESWDTQTFLKEINSAL